MKYNILTNLYTYLFLTISAGNGIFSYIIHCFQTLNIKCPFVTIEVQIAGYSQSNISKQSIPRKDLEVLASVFVIKCGRINVLWLLWEHSIHIILIMSPTLSGTTANRLKSSQYHSRHTFFSRFSHVTLSSEQYCGGLF
jgi:hypothetical protein